MWPGVDFFVACDELRGPGWDLCAGSKTSLLLGLHPPPAKSRAVMCECVYPTQWPAAAGSR